MKLEKQILETYKLADSFIIPTPMNATNAEINDAIAEAAAMYINNRIQPDAFINIGYGDTMGKPLITLPKTLITPFPVFP
jgi:lsr operon transcriptional repressor